MRIIWNLFKWTIRIIGLLMGFKELVFGELFISGLALIRFKPDQLVRVVTGFVGSEDYGHYEYTDNAGSRFGGWFFCLIAFCCKVVLFCEICGIDWQALMEQYI